LSARSMTLVILARRKMLSLGKPQVQIGK
jgi:hypothetical protein